MFGGPEAIIRTAQVSERCPDRFVHRRELGLRKWLLFFVMARQTRRRVLAALVRSHSRLVRRVLILSHRDVAVQLTHAFVNGFLGFTAVLLDL